MYFRLFSVLSVLIVLGCSNLDSLTEEKLRFAEKRWNEEAPGLYKMKVEMTGNRTESSIFEVTVRSDVVVSLKRNGLVVRAGREQDYSMQGLFAMLWQELELAKQPELLGAPAGYNVHLLVRFDDQNAGIKHYRRTVAGSGNSIEMRVLNFEPQ